MGNKQNEPLTSWNRSGVRPFRSPRLPNGTSYFVRVHKSWRLAPEHWITEAADVPDGESREWK